ncbi:MAG: putative PEP-binding protein, partial [Dehalococcoidia bacterium]
KALSWLEKRTGKALGNGLMVSVRSSAPVSMPGMMDTILNVGSRDQIMSCITTVFSSWNNARAVEYRRLHNIPPDLGTSAVVQAMVMGNRDDKSGTGVVFSRDPSTGARGLFGEYLARAQGEELVSGARTPQPIDSLRSDMPEVYAELEEMGGTLENHFRDMQDVEFTVESGKLYMLQTRSGKRSGQAAVKIAVDLVEEGLISREEALLRVSPEDVMALLHNRIDSPESYQPITKGLNAAPGATTGIVLFEPREVVAAAEKNERTILVRPETSPDDIQGISAANGVLTSRGGLTSHAAIVTRAMGKPCVCGAEEVVVDLKTKKFRVGDTVVKKDDTITIDGTTGNVYLGDLPLVEGEATPELARLLSWADQVKQIGVWGNADTAQMVRLVKRHGAEGIGLCRTERQFHGPERLAAVRNFILGETDEERAAALLTLRKLQRNDFIALFRELRGMSVIIRLLDLPLHEFLPPEEQVQDPRLKKRLKELKEVNPMLGHRGVRLAVTYPEVYQMQVQAIAEARAVVDANVALMVPQVITDQELMWVKRHIEEQGLRVGVMMETVRACMRAGKLAYDADFFSSSREDAEKKFLTTYLEAGLLEDNPFEIVDVKGVGRLMETAIYWAKKEKQDLEIGVCGEHAGEPRSIRFFHDIGVTYVSCSAYRIPVAKLAAAQAAIKNPRTLAARA